jgi:signal recognition particle subunit SRP72
MPTKRKSNGSSVVSNNTLSELFSRLTLAASTNDYDRVLSISNEVLKSSPTDSRAAKQKIIALIKLDKYREALTFLGECSFLRKEDTLLEKGFCLYKLGQGAEAEKVLEEGAGRGVLHIRAQNVSLSSRLIDYRHTEWRILPMH